MANGGIIGPINVISKGGNTVTIKTSGSSTITTQPGTKLANVVIVGGGGGGGGAPSCACGGGGGGAGGVVAVQSLSVCGATGYPVSVGGGGAVATTGSDSTGFCLTAKGGGGGGGYNVPQEAGLSGGSGGGGSGNAPGNSPFTAAGGSATQPSQPGDSGTYGFGHAGGNGFYTSPPTGAQGGGGGGAGVAAGTNNSGGCGLSSSITGSGVARGGGGSQKGGCGTPAPGTGGGGTGSGVKLATDNAADTIRMEPNNTFVMGIEDDRVEITRPVIMPTYSVSTLPTLGSSDAGAVAYCDNGNAGAPCMVFHTGSAWRKTHDPANAPSAT